MPVPFPIDEADLSNATKAVINAIAAGGGGGGGGGTILIAMRPDYANMETVNRWSATNLSWTSDRDGYVWVEYGYDAGDNHNGVFINGKRVTIAASNANANGGGGTVLPIKKDDVVSAQRWATGYGVQCMFIPPRYDEVPPPVYATAVDSDYSLTEKPVMTFDTVTQSYRQATWVDGKGIWQRTFQHTTGLVADNAPKMTDIATVEQIESMIKHEAVAGRNNGPTANPANTLYGTTAPQSNPNASLRMTATAWVLESGYGFRFVTAVFANWQENSPVWSTVQYTKA
jgi:hypothetical protein